MPIVDAYANLGSSRNSVRSYLKRANSMHILRMIAVQRPKEATRLLEDLIDLRAQSATPGLGGFPNAVVCPCNINDNLAVTSLINAQNTQLLSGVWHDLADIEFSHVPVSALASLELLAQDNLSLDINSRADQTFIVKELAEAQPNLVVVVNIHLGCFVNTEQSTKELCESLALLASSSNIYLKLFGAGLSKTKLEKSLEGHLNFLLSHFSDERIMFGSGCFLDAKTDDLVSFDQLWRIYLEKSSAISARARDKIFRTNAMRVYVK